MKKWLAGLGLACQFYSWLVETRVYCKASGEKRDDYCCDRL